MRPTSLSSHGPEAEARSREEAIRDEDLDRQYALSQTHAYSQTHSNSIQNALAALIENPVEDQHEPLPERREEKEHKEGKEEKEQRDQYDTMFNEFNKEKLTKQEYAKIAILRGIKLYREEIVHSFEGEMINPLTGLKTTNVHGFWKRKVEEFNDRLKAEGNVMQKDLLKMHRTIGETKNALIKRLVDKHRKDIERKAVIEWDKYNDPPGDPAFHVGFGKVKGHNNGLYDSDIDKIMQMHPEFVGCISRDEIKHILPHVQAGKKICWIMYTDPAYKQGAHWFSVYIDPVGSKSVEYFDSFGREIPSDIQKDLKLVVDIMKPSTFLKLKSNHVIHQANSTNNCGYMAAKFLLDRLRGKSFAEASGYNEVTHKLNASGKYEAEIERLKSVAPFNYIN